MATESVRASVTRWKVGPTGRPKVEKTDAIDETFDDVADEGQIKLRLLAGWILEELAAGNKPDDVLGGVQNGLVTVEVLERKAITPPPVSDEMVLENFLKALRGLGAPAVAQQ